MVQLRQAPSGPLISGNNLGDTLVWAGIALGWVPGAAAAAGAFDHVVSTLADLPAPVAGVITLTDGSWAFKASVDVGANVVSVPSGTTVLLKGMGGFGEKVLTGTDTRVLLIEGSAYIETLTVEADNGGGGVAVELANNAFVQSQSCRFLGDTQGVTMSAGLWRDSLSRITGGTEAIIMTGGTLNFSQTRLLAGTEAALAASGPDVDDVFLQGCTLNASSVDTVRWDCPGGNFYAVDTEIVCGDASSACVLVLVGLAMQFVGGRLDGSGGSGIFIDGNITRMLQLSGLQGFGLGIFVERNSGTVRQATVQGCATFSDVAVAVDWAAANIPTNGLVLVGNNFDTATPIANFTESDARVNLKACTLAGGLMTETAIVP